MSACAGPCIHPLALTMRVVRCPAGAREPVLHTLTDVCEGRGHDLRRLGVERALLLRLPRGGVAARVSLIANAWLCGLWGAERWLPALPPARVRHGIGSVHLAASRAARAAPSDCAPVLRHSRDGVCPSPRDELKCAFERRISSRVVLYFIKLSYISVWCAWAALERLPSARESVGSSSLNEGFVPQKLIGYPS